MTARAQAVASARRRPAGRRRPAARRGGSRVNWDRVGRIALTLVLAAVVYSYFNPAVDFVKTYMATTATKARFHEQLRENKRLHWQVQHSDDPVVLDEKARGQGLVGEGDNPIVVRSLPG
jgi:hypothetical protein